MWHFGNYKKLLNADIEFSCFCESTVTQGLSLAAITWCTHLMCIYTLITCKPYHSLFWKLPGFECFSSICNIWSQKSKKRCARQRNCGHRLWTLSNLETRNILSKSKTVIWLYLRNHDRLNDGTFSMSKRNQFYIPRQCDLFDWRLTFFTQLQCFAVGTILLVFKHPNLRLVLLVRQTFFGVFWNFLVESGAETFAFQRCTFNLLNYDGSVRYVHENAISDAIYG